MAFKILASASICKPRGYRISYSHIHELLAAAYRKVAPSTLIGLN